MKLARITFRTALLLLLAAALQLASLPRAHAANPARVNPGDLLLSGPWKISGDGAGYVLTFARNGTFTTDNLLDQPGHWKLTRDALTLIFADGHSDILKLPLDPRGTAGSGQGQAITATLANDTAAAPPPMPAPATAPPAVPAISPAISTPAPAAPIAAAATPAPPGAPTVALLVTGAWKLSKGDRSDIRIFGKDGTFTTPGNEDEHGKWTMTRDFIILIFPSGHKDALTLPLNPQGTGGYADNGDTITAVLLPGAEWHNSGAGGEFYLPVQPASVPLAYGGQASIARAIDTITALLTSGPWKMTGAKWFAVRTFAREGTFTTAARPKEQGTWNISGNTINMVFEDGHTDTLALPLDAKGTAGTGGDGKNFSAVLQIAPAAQSTPVPGSMDAVLHPQAAPHGLTSADKARIAGVLIAAPWKITGASWSAIRIFAGDGTFTTIGRPKEFGNWNISDKSILLIYQDKHIDTLTLPLDSRNTDGTDRKGAPVIAVQQAPDPGGGFPTPAPTAAPFTATPKPAPAEKGATPPPYGTENPGGATPAPHAPAAPFGTGSPL